MDPNLTLLHSLSIHSSAMKKLLLPIAVVASLSNQAFGQGTCATATPVTSGQYTVAPLSGTAPTLVCVGASTVAAFGTWFSYTATQDTSIQVSSHVAGFADVDTRMHVYVGGCGSLVCYAGDDDSGPGYSSISAFAVTAGTTYYIAWDSYWTNNGFTFTVQEYDVPPPPQGVVNFTPAPLPGAGYVMGAVDMNNDGLDDAVTPGYTSVMMNYQIGSGGFTTTPIAHSAAANTASWSFAVGDIDDNGYNDMLYGGGSGATFMIANATGTGFTQNTFPQYIFCQRTNFVDVDQDGHLDGFSCHDVDANVYFMNDGSNNLSFNQSMLGTTCGNYGSVWTDYDNNGRVDLFVAKCGCDPVDLLMRNNSTMNFTSMAGSLGLADGHQSWSSAWADYDNDGDMDGFIGASSSGYHKLMRNNGDGTFTDVTLGSGMDTYSGQSIEWTCHDFNNDGYVDIIGAGAIHYNNGNMTFSHDATAPGNGPVGDLNNDGFLDIVNGSSVMLNQGNDNNWIKIIPVGTYSNRNGIGARVKVTTAAGTQIRDIKSGDGFEYMSTLYAYFGLGAATEIIDVTIEWPSGVVDHVDAPAINTPLTVTEGFFTGVATEDVSTFGVYPNPANDVLVVTGAAPNSNVNILDATGKLVSTTTNLAGRVDVAFLPAGVYQLVVNDGTMVQKARFTKQ